jgi:hypothetical protein
MTTTHTPTTETTVCPAWCNDHDAFEDGSANWHKSRLVTVAEHELYLTTGTHSGLPEVFVEDVMQDGSLTLTQARDLAGALLSLVTVAEQATAGGAA